MGKIISVGTPEVKPIQLEINRFKLGRAWEFYRNGSSQKLLPTIARAFKGNLVTLDGTHRTAISDLLSEEVRVYVPDSNEDFVGEEYFAEELEIADPEERADLVEAFNDLIYANFRRVPSLLKEMERVGISNYEALRRRHGLLRREDLETLN